MKVFEEVIAMFSLGILLAILSSAESKDVFTSAITMAKMFDTEQAMVETVNKYLERQEKVLNSLKILAEKLKEPDVTSIDDETDFILNPIKMFVILNNLIESWDEAQKLMKINVYNDVIGELVRNSSIILPTEVDYRGTINSLIILQDTYELSIDDLLRGDIKGIKAEQGLSSEDCIAVVDECMRLHRFLTAIDWLQGCLKLYNEEDNKDINVKKKILEMFYKSYMMSRKFQDALIYIYEYLNLDPENKEAKLSKAFILKHVNKALS